MQWVHLSPHFPPNFYLFANRFRQRGGKVLGITDQSIQQLRPELRESLHDHEPVNSLHNETEVLAAVDRLISRNGKIDLVESHLEPWLPLEAKIRQVFNIVGAQPSEIEGIQQKSRMKDIFRQAGALVVEGEILRSLEQGIDFITKHGLPVIIKPDTGIGAQDTHKIESLKDLQFFYENRNPGNYFIEVFVEGDIVTFDGLCNAYNEPLFFTSHQYSHDARAIAEQKLDFYYFNYRNIPQDLEQLGKAILKLIPSANKFFHLEFFRTPKGSLVALEINMRPPGGLTTDMFNYATDQDVYDLWARVVLEGLRTYPYERKYHCAHISRRESNAHNYKHSHQQCIEHLGQRLCHYRQLNPLYATLMGEHAYLIRTSQMQELQQIAEYLHAQ